MQQLGDVSFQIIEINDNVYKVDLLGEYGVTTTFNVSDLSLFDVGDNSRLNSFKEREGNASHPANTKDGENQQILSY